MRRRIERHRRERGEGWVTVEEPVDLAGALDRLAPAVEVAVVDCLTVWLGNLVHRLDRRREAPLAESSGPPGERATPPAAPASGGASTSPRGTAGAGGRPDLADPATFPEIAALLSRLDAPPCRLIVVSNELGWGIVPENALARAFRDLAGRVNEEVARRADRVVLMVAGRPLELPGGRGG